jgi:hypothetical protein
MLTNFYNEQKVSGLSPKAPSSTNVKLSKIIHYRNEIPNNFLKVSNPEHRR